MTGFRGIFEEEGDPGDPQIAGVEDEDGSGEDKLDEASVTKHEPNDSKEENVVF